MTKTELEAIAKRKDEFLQEMVRKHGLALEYIVRLLKAKNVVYNKSKEGEIDTVIAEVINKEVERKRAELKSKLEAHPISPADKCWLADTPGIMCQGTITRKGDGLPKCTEGGMSHYFAMRSSNPVHFLENYEFIKKEHSRVNEEQLKHYREEMAKPFVLAKYQNQESFLDE